MQNLALTADGGQPSGNVYDIQGVQCTVKLNQAGWDIWDNQKYFLLLQTLNAIIYAIFVCFSLGWDLSEKNGINQLKHLLDTLLPVNHKYNVQCCCIILVCLLFSDFLISDWFLDLSNHSNKSFLIGSNKIVDNFISKFLGCP